MPVSFQLTNLHSRSRLLNKGSSKVGSKQVLNSPQQQQVVVGLSKEKTKSADTRWEAVSARHIKQNLPIESSFSRYQGNKSKQKSYIGQYSRPFLKSSNRAQSSKSQRKQVLDSNKGKHSGSDKNETIIGQKIVIKNSIE